MRFVIAGTWRGGTNFAANVLNLLGVDCTHESAFQVALCDFSLGGEAEVSPAAAFHLHIIKAVCLPLVHLIRPRDLVVASMKKWGGPITGDVGQYWDETHALIRRENPVATIELGDDSETVTGFQYACLILGFPRTREQIAEAVKGADRKTYESVRNESS
jgi:hypothetical protein